MPNTPLGYIDYPVEGDTNWYSGGDGLEDWLTRAELLGFPTYSSFSDLPDPSTTVSADPSSTQPQRQFAAVVGEKTIYRVSNDQTQWVEWLSYDNGDADTVDGYHGSDLAALSENETITGEWTFREDVRASGSSTTEDSGDGVIEVKPDSGTALDGHFRWLAADGGNRGTLMYDGDSDQIRFWDYSAGENKLVISLGSTGQHVNFPQGAASNNNPFVASSEGKEYDIQKDGVDGAGVINFNTVDSEITIDGEVVISGSSDGGSSTTTLETWEDGTADQTWGTNDYTISQTQAYEGSYGAYATAGGGNQRAYDYETGNNGLTQYQRIGDSCRAFFYHPSSSSNIGSTTRARWGYGGDWGNNYVIQYDLQYETFRLYRDGTGTEIAGTLTIPYPGGEWWAIESEWTDPTHTARIVNYSDPSNPVVEGELTVDDTNIGDASAGQYWGAWNSSSADMYVDHAVFY